MINRVVQSLVIAVALTQFGFIMSMKLDQSEKIPPAETASIYIPPEVLSQIFQYFAQRTTSGDPDIKSSLVLRLVSKDFKETIDDYPCFLAPTGFDESDSAPRFLHFNLVVRHCRRNLNIVKLHNKKIAKKFLSYFSHFSYDDRFRISMKLDENDINTFLSSYLKTLLPLLNQVSFRLKIDTSPISTIRLWKNKGKSPLTLSFYQSYISNFEQGSSFKNFKYLEGMVLGLSPYSNDLKAAKVVFPKNLDMFGDVRSIEVNSNDFELSNIVWPKNLERLKLSWCEDSELGSLNNISSLKHLSLFFMKNLTDESLRKICPEKLKYLCSFSVRYCDQFIGNTKEIKALRENGCKIHIYPHDSHPKKTWSKKNIALVLVPTVLAGAGLSWYLWKKEPVKTMKGWLSQTLKSP